MAVYKVPQDVEADDKLIGPFSFRQFIYLIIVAMAIAIAWGLSQLFIPLAIIPLPIIIFFGALALPLKKDQPMEVYLAAVVSFYLKPRNRLWEAGGIQSLVEITAPKTTEPSRTKGISDKEVARRLSYLAQVVDTGGWAVRGVSAAPIPNTAMNDDLYFEAQQTNDMLDDNSGVGMAFESKLAAADQQRRQSAINNMYQNNTAPAPETQNAPQPVTSPQSTPQPQHQPTQNQEAQPLNYSPIKYSPYPNSMSQSVIQPISNPPQETNPAQSIPSESITENTHPPVEAKPEELVEKSQAPASTSAKEVSPDIINLANNSYLSIETIANEAERIKKKESSKQDDEVVISLR